MSANDVIVPGRHRTSRPALGPPAQQLSSTVPGRGGGRCLRRGGPHGLVPGRRACLGGPALLRRPGLQRPPPVRTSRPSTGAAFAVRRPTALVAAAQGAAIGGGCGLALSADFRVARGRAGSVPFRPPRLPPRLRAQRDPAGRARPPARGRPPADGPPCRGRGGAGPRPVRPAGRCRRGRLRARSHHYGGELAAAGPLAVRAIRATLRQGLVDQARLAMEHEHAEQERLRLPRTSPKGCAPPRNDVTPPFTGACRRRPPTSSTRRSPGPTTRARSAPSPPPGQSMTDGFFVLENASARPSWTPGPGAIDPIEARQETRCARRTAAPSSSPGPTRSPSPPTS